MRFIQLVGLGYTMRLRNHILADRPRCERHFLILRTQLAESNISVSRLLLRIIHWVELTIRVDKEMARQGILLQHGLDVRIPTVEALPHVDRAQSREGPRCRGDAEDV